ncbi:Predicted phosphoesterase [Aliiroseovarius sediminilitoris]|uniref:Predicted phosphoesterase n=1 Tax=Aliiroseovarius sediminilitoris TaxID=1173584 RepID=A0A1I0QSM7_9RHOB|nr:metallophosphoesterase [Aliiroseovarius sediminilitoris]SEW30616.1 Predicted phosphoesterase [Aliiroseovarius sediminilitoris]
MKILAFSDLHLSNLAARNLLDAASDADLILGVGDYAHRRDGLVDYVAPFADWGTRAVFVPGNNETETELRAAFTGSDVTILHGETATIGGLTIAGIGAAIPPPPAIPWRSFDLTEDEARSMLTPITGADILISHSPPKGVADQHSELGSLGSHAVLEAVTRLAPKWVLCGHIHDAWGARGQIGASKVMNLGPTPNWITLN